jgi:hypothetical protein
MSVRGYFIHAVGGAELSDWSLSHSEGLIAVLDERVLDTYLTPHMEDDWSEWMAKIQAFQGEQEQQEQQEQQVEVGNDEERNGRIAHIEDQPGIREEASSGVSAQVATASGEASSDRTFN